MRYALLAMVLLCGCSEKKTNTMVDVAEMLRTAAKANSVDGLLKTIPCKHDLREPGEFESEWLRFPAADGYVWIEAIYSPRIARAAFVSSTIQFSTSGKREH